MCVRIRLRRFRVPVTRPHSVAQAVTLTKWQKKITTKRNTECECQRRCGKKETWTDYIHCIIIIILGTTIINNNTNEARTSVRTNERTNEIERFSSALKCRTTCIIHPTIFRLFSMLLYCSSRVMCIQMYLEVEWWCVRRWWMYDDVDLIFPRTIFGVWPACVSSCAPPKFTLLAFYNASIETVCVYVCMWCGGAPRIYNEQRRKHWIRRNTRLSLRCEIRLGKPMSKSIKYQMHERTNEWTRRKKKTSDWKKEKRTHIFEQN